MCACVYTQTEAIVPSAGQTTMSSAAEWHDLLPLSTADTTLCTMYTEAIVPSACQTPMSSAQNGKQNCTATFTATCTVDSGARNTPASPPILHVCACSAYGALTRIGVMVNHAAACPHSLHVFQRYLPVVRKCIQTNRGPLPADGRLSKVSGPGSCVHQHIHTGWTFPCRSTLCHEHCGSSCYTPALHTITSGLRVGPYPCQTPLSTKIKPASLPTRSIAHELGVTPPQETQLC